MDKAILLLPIGAVSINVLAQLCSYRFANLSYMRSVFFGFALGMTVLWLGTVGIYAAGLRSGFETLFFIVGDMGIYIGLGYVFFNFINIGESSIRVRILRELKTAGGQMPEATLLARYNDYEILNLRLGRLRSNGSVAIHDGRLTVTSQVLLVLAAIMRTMKQLLLNRRSEFER